MSSYPQQYEFRAELRDGREVLIRPIRPEDASAHRELMTGVSPQTFYNRMFGLSKVTDEAIERFTRIDYDREIAIVARVEQEGREVTIGVNRLVYDPDSGAHEFAVVVADPWQGGGLGSVLMEKLLFIARDRKIATIQGFVLADNQRMLGLARKFGFVACGRNEDAVVVRLELNG